MNREAPPSLRRLIDACVHCGFCLPACPTYLLDGEEMDSPRGRIYLMKAVMEGRASLTPAYVGHIDGCLGCMACVPACPSGVQYGTLVEHARAAIEREHTRPAGDRWFRRLLFAVLPYPRRLRAAALAMWLLAPVRRLLESSGLARRLPPRLAALVALAPPVRLGALLRGGAIPGAAGAAPRLRVGLLAGCVQGVFFSHVNDATARVLAAEGCEIVVPAAQGCCGALGLHAGREADARDFARRLVAAFRDAGVDRIVVNAAGCGSAMKEYGRLLAGDPEWADPAREFAAKVVDVSEALDELGPPQAARHPVPMRVAYHDACHLSHAQGVTRQPRAQLATIPGLEIVPLAESDVCCGSAGIHNLVEPEQATRLGDRKAAHVLAAAPDAIASGNPGCLLQLAAALARAGAPRPLYHPVEILDASIRGLSADELRRQAGRRPYRS